jgi:hypothetical protein
MKKLLLVSAALIAIPAVASAGDTLKIRSFSHLTSVNSQDVGDVPGHTMTLIRVDGIAEFSDGTLGTCYFTVFTDYTKGSGAIPASYVNITAADGSMLWLNSPGSAQSDGKKTTLKGTIQVLGGSGRFTSVEGDGVWSGTRLQPLPTAGAELYNELTINLK